MKITLKLEEVVQLGLSIYLFSLLPYEWYWFLILILLPDIGMIGYMAGTKAGAISYNIFHHKGIALVIYLLGAFVQLPWLMLAGIILFGHSAMDRIFGYGLKYPDHFKHTHLDTIY